MDRRSLVVLAAAALFAAPACHRASKGDPRARVPIAIEGAAYDAPDAEHPHLAFPDGTKTANDRCMILQHKLNLKIPPIYVNGTPVGFC